MPGASVPESTVKSPTQLRAAVRDFYEDYAQSLDDGDLNAWLNYFPEECHYRVLSRENYDAGLPIGFIYCMNKNMIRDRITALRETTMFQPRQLRRFISGVRINNVKDDVINAQANFMVTECLSDAEPIISVVGQYRDQIVNSGDGFQFAYRDCILDNYRIHTSLIMPI